MIDPELAGNSRKTRREIGHDIVAKHIAGTWFPFPGQNTNPEVTRVFGLWPSDLVAIVNVDKQRAIQSGGKTWYPDIVVVDGEGAAREIGETLSSGRV